MNNWFPPLPGDQPNEEIIPIGQSEDETPERGEPMTRVSTSLTLPVSDGEVTLTLSAERDQDGDWRVYLPDVSEFDVASGIVYLAGPEDPCAGVYQPVVGRPGVTKCDACGDESNSAPGLVCGRVEEA